MDSRVAKSLEDGPDYAVNWRELVVEKYLVEVAAAPEPLCRLQEIMWTERDPFVRQFLRFRFNGRSANQDGFRYALQCKKSNHTLGTASMIRAMLVADRSPEEIADELGTKALNVATFAKLFFDVRRYLGNETWLRQVVLHDPRTGMGDAEASRDRRWLSAALHRGWQGVEQVVLQRLPASTADLEKLTVTLQSALLSRALEYTHNLQDSDAPPDADDLARFVACRSLQTPASGDRADQRIPVSMWCQAVFGDLQKRAEQEPHDPDLAIFREMKAKDAAGQLSAPQRLRKRFEHQ